jgi:hypothetical protein
MDCASATPLPLFYRHDLIHVGQGRLGGRKPWAAARLT